MQAQNDKRRHKETLQCGTLSLMITACVGLNSSADTIVPIIRMKLENCRARAVSRSCAVKTTNIPISADCQNGASKNQLSKRGKKECQTCNIGRELMHHDAVQEVLISCVISRSKQRKRAPNSRFLAVLTLPAKVAFDAAPSRKNICPDRIQTIKNNEREINKHDQQQQKNW